MPMKILDSDPQQVRVKPGVFKVKFDRLDVPRFAFKVTACPPCPEGMNVVLWEQLHKHASEHGFPDIRQVITDNAIKDMMAEEDAKIFKIMGEW